MKEDYKDISDLFYQAWYAYHSTSEKIDGHIRVPRNQEEREILSQAVKAGTQALNNVLEKAGFDRRSVMYDSTLYAIWNNAKILALMDVEREIQRNTIEVAK